jgi:hypothetical protein
MREMGKRVTSTPMQLEFGSLELVPDAELERLAGEAGPSSTAAAIIRELGMSRSKDRQVFAFHIHEFFFIGPMPDAKTEAELLALAELNALAC